MNALDNLTRASQDIESHLPAWETALSACLTTATNEDDKSYWQHELNAIKRDGANLRAALAKASGGAHEAR